jgi:hypothetical protein
MPTSASPIYQYAAENNRKIVNLDAFAEKFPRSARWAR